MGMTQEEKELLIKDLSTRLPYGVKIHVEFNGKVYDEELQIVNKSAMLGDYGPVPVVNSVEYDINDGFELTNVKPYLRQMSSMTEEEKKDILQSLNIHGDIDNEGNLLLGVECDIITLKVCKKYLGELNKRMFDVCHMIEKGLAIEAPEGMYKPV